jgi:Ala-tRNA(Pro) deacylase
MPTEANITAEEARLYAALTDLGIAWVRHEHPPVFTVEEAERHWSEVRGAHCKNLFLRNKKGNHHYLVVIESSKQADLRRLNTLLDEDRLSFASPERLKRFLGLDPGAVSPFGLLNDAGREVVVVLDQDLRGAETVNFHPNVNTATVGISYGDLERFIAWWGNRVLYFPFA